ncbi:hypothetical protein [Bifidobacterium longum]|uniref:hypothetical protein n=1 Tax=Bifidobacterium longum TaxID=216816 RepID=UPI0020248BEB|nr:MULTISPECIES: hypothetical protein [Bifidobacterium]
MDNDKRSEQENGGVDDSGRLRFLVGSRVGRSEINQSVRQRSADADAENTGKAGWRGSRSSSRRFEQSEESKQFAENLRKRWKEWGYD